MLYFKNKFRAFFKKAPVFILFELLIHILSLGAAAWIGWIHHVWVFANPLPSILWFVLIYVVAMFASFLIVTILILLNVLSVLLVYGIAYISSSYTIALIADHFIDRMKKFDTWFFKRKIATC